MARQFATDIRNDWLDRWESLIGTSALLKIFTGAQPANCAAADSGTILASMTLPSDWMGAAASGSKALSGTWEDPSADNSGTAAHYRIYTSGGVCKEQGSVTASGGGGDMTLDSGSAVITAGQRVVIATFTTTAPGA